MIRMHVMIALLIISVQIQLLNSGESYWDNSFTFPGLDGDVEVITSFEDKIIVGGGFKYAYHNGEFTELNNIGIWNGTQWEALADGLNEPVIDIAVNEQGHIYVVGSFTQAGDVDVNRVAVWRGSQWEALGEGLSAQFSFSVNAVAIGQNGNVYVGGSFSQAGGKSTYALAMWDGDEWHAVGGGIQEVWGTDSFPGTVRDIQIHDDGSVYVGGSFNRAGNTAVRNLAVWDGEQWHDVGGGAGDDWRSVNALHVNGNDLYVGGDFTSVGGGSVNANFIAKWDGQEWTSFGQGTNDHVRTIAVDTQGKIYVGGSFLFRFWDGDGWNVVGGGVGWGFYYVNTVHYGNDNVYIGGRFFSAGYDQYSFNDENEYNTIGVARIARWNVNEEKWYTVGEGGNGVVGEINTIATGQFGELYIGGRFTIAGNIEVSNIARWDGTTWTSLGGGVNGEVYAIAADGEYVYVGGIFTHAGEVPVNRIARWDGEQWIDLDGGVHGYIVQAIEINGNDVYIGGFFGEAGNVEAHNVARWDGTQWHSLGDGVFNGVQGVVYALASHGEDLFVGGSFTQAGGSSANNIARWDGMEWDRLRGGVNGIVRSIAVYRNDIIVGGNFTHAHNGVPVGDILVNRVARWNRSGWAAMGSGFSGWFEQVNAVTVSDDKIFAGGTFWGYVAQWTGAGWMMILPSVGAGETVPEVNTLAAGGTLFVGGRFEVAGGMNDSFNLARWIEPLPENYVYVGLHGDDENIGSFKYPVRTLAHANNLISEGGIIHLFSGVYEEQFTPTVNLQLIAMNNAAVDEIIVSNGIELDILSNLKILGSIDIPDGRIETGYAMLVLGEDATVTESPGNYIIGKIRSDRYIGSAGMHDFGGIGVEIESPVDIGEVTLIRHTGPIGRVSVNNNSGIDRTWRILNGGDGFDNGANPILTLQWLSDDDNGIDSSRAQVWRATSDETQWGLVGAEQDVSGSDPRSISVNVSSLGTFTVSDVSRPLSFQHFIVLNRPLDRHVVAGGADYPLQWRAGDAVESVLIEFRYDSDDEWTVLYQDVAPRKSGEIFGEQIVPIPDIVVTNPDELLASMLENEPAARWAQFRVSATNEPGLLGESGRFEIIPEAKLENMLRRKSIHDDSYYVFRIEYDTWSFGNSVDNIWPQSWWHQFIARYEELREKVWSGFDVRAREFPDWDLFCCVYGHDRCYRSSGVPTSTARKLWSAIRIDNWGGSCFGFSLSSLRHFNYSQYVADNINIPFENLRDLPISAATRRIVNQHQVYSYHPLAWADLSVKWLNRPNTTLARVRDDMGTVGNHRMLYMRHRTVDEADEDKRRWGAHAVVPIYIRDIGNDTVHIYVYEMGRPAEVRTVTINTADNTWSYDVFNGWDVPRSYGLIAYGPVNIFSGAPLLQYDTLDDEVYTITKSSSNRILSNSDESVTVYVSDSTNIVIENMIGEQIGITDENDTLHTLPNSIPIYYLDANAERYNPQAFFIPQDDRYVITLEYKHPGERFALWNNDNVMYRYGRPEAQIGESELLIVDDGLTVRNLDVVQKDIMLETIIVPDEIRERSFAILNMSLGADDSIRVYTDMSDRFFIDNQGKAKQFDFFITQSDEYVFAEGYYRSISISEDARQMIVANWDDLAAEPLLILVDTNRDGIFDDTLSVKNDLITGGIGTRDNTPELFRLMQNYPNPFNSQTVIMYSIPAPVNVKLEVFDLLGRRIATLIDEYQNPGYYDVIFDASHIASGVYIFRLQAGDYVESKKLLLLK